MTIYEPECSRAALAATLLFLLAGCAGTAPPATVGSADATAAAESTAGSTQTDAAEPLTADTLATTVRGNRFVAPEGWTLSVRGPATILGAPEGDSWIALVDVEAADAGAAVSEAWQAYDPRAEWPLEVVHEQPDRDGWSQRRTFVYRTPPNARRSVLAFTRLADDVWTVAIYDMSQPVAEKRGGQVALVFDRLLPKGYERESFAGTQAHPLDEERLAELARFVADGLETLGVPGAALGIVENGEVVLVRGFGVRDLQEKRPVEADTLFMVASNTKALTTLLLARLVDRGAMRWETPVTTLLPSFRLGDPETTEKVLVEHLICACTGLPRQDFEWLFEFGDMTPEGAMATLGTMQPTSEFGELFQYSNPMAAAAGFVGGHVLYPEAELGEAYDRAMRVEVFEPLGMASTTFDFEKALAGDHALPYAPDVDGDVAPAVMGINYAVIPVRPAGAAWSTVPDMLSYVQMELAEGLLADGTRYISREPLLARRDELVAIGNDAIYGMGLMVDSTYGVPVVHHGGDMIGYHSDMMWLPDHGVGAVILTNGDPGWILRSQFRRKLLEVLFDGRPEAEAQMAAAGESFYDQLAAEREQLTVPAAPAHAAKLAPRYANPALGEIDVLRPAGADGPTVFDFGEWQSPMATRENDDGTVSFVTTAPGISGFEFVVGGDADPRTLVVRDAQHEYVFEER